MDSGERVFAYRPHEGQQVGIGISPTDPLSYIALTIFTLLVALLALWLPAARAAAVDPVEALRRG